MSACLWSFVALLAVTAIACAQPQSIPTPIPPPASASTPLSAPAPAPTATPAPTPNSADESGITPVWTVVPLSPNQVIQKETFTVTPSVPIPLDPFLNSLVNGAKEDLVRLLSIDPSQIELLEVNSVVWPDTSLGCPQPGMAYTQVQRDGALMRFDVESTIYEYHSGADRPPFLCRKSKK